MTKVSQLVVESPVPTVEFRRFASEAASSARMENLVKEFGVVYVTSITRDGCSGCAEQKPLFKELAAKMVSEHKSKVSFSNIHIRYSKEDQLESAESKKLLGHAAYPAYMVHVRSRFGPLEAYRAVYPSMAELEKQANETLELAEFYKEDAEKAKQ